MPSAAEKAPRIHRIPSGKALGALRVPGIADLLVKGMSAAGEHDMRPVLRDFLDDSRQLWVMFSTEDAAGPLAVWTTQIVENEKTGARDVHVSALAGRQVKSWGASLAQSMMRFARDEGCKSVRFAGKRGWEKLLPDFDVVGNEEGAAIFERAVA